MILKSFGVEGLDAHEQVIQLSGVLTAVESLTKILVFEDDSEGPQALTQNFLSVGNEQEARALDGFVGGVFYVSCEAGVIKGRDHGFSGTSGSDQEVFVAAMDLALRLEMVEHFSLKRMWRDVK